MFNADKSICAEVVGTVAAQRWGIALMVDGARSFATEFVRSTSLAASSAVLRIGLGINAFLGA